MQQTVIPGFWMWSQWQPDRSVFFNSYFIEAPSGNLLVDPLPIDDALERAIVERGGVAWIVVTNRDHERATADAATRFTAKVAASTPEAELLTVSVDRTLAAGEVICGASVLALWGMKSPLEVALHFRGAAAVVVGDALWGVPAGSLSLPPRVGDTVEPLLSLRVLRSRKPRHILPGRRDADLHPPAYRSQAGEIGHYLGATVMGYQSALLPPGTSVCPAHWHTVDEELFIVWEGTPLLRTPQGQTRLRRGDIVCFPANEYGTHKVTNDTDAPCRIIMIASNEKPDDACFYPDSDKVLISAKSIILRSSPSLGYFDGE